MRIAIDHQLSLLPPAGTHHLVLQLLLTAPSGPTQRVESWSVEAPGIGNAARFPDAFGNTAHLVNHTWPEGRIVVRARGIVATVDTAGVLGRSMGEPVSALFKRATPLTAPDLGLVEQLAATSGTRLDLLHHLMGTVHDRLSGDQASTATQGQSQSGQSQNQMQADGTPAADDPPAPPTDAARTGAHLFIATARALDIPARFVSGYLAAEDGSSARLHAWAEAFDDSLGWIGFDPSLAICPAERHVRLAIGLDDRDAEPLRAAPGDAVVEDGSVAAGAAQ